MKIGFIGLGAMGSALAARLIPDYEVHVWDIHKAPVDALAKLGALPVDSAASMARECELILLCLPRSSDVKQVIFGSDGLLEGLSEGKIIVDHTSGIPGETAAMALELTKAGLFMIDAPVAGGVPSAEAGKIAIMASGPDEAYQKAHPVLSAISPKVYRVSARVGDGQAVKLVNNSINAGYRMMTLELVALGRRLGLGLGQIKDALNDGRGGNYTARHLLPALVDDRPSADFSLALMVKDLNQAISLGIAHGVPMPIANLARGLMQIGVNLLGDDAKLDDIVPFMGSIAKVDIAGSQKALHAPPPYPSIDGGDALKRIDNAAAASNRLIVLENAAMGLKLGLTLEAMAIVILNGSGWSAECERILPASGGGGQPTSLTLGEVVEEFDHLAQLGFSCGAPMIVLNEVRATYKARANEAGDEADIDAMTSHYEAIAAVSFAERL